MATSSTKKLLQINHFSTLSSLDDLKMLIANLHPRMAKGCVTTSVHYFNFTIDSIPIGYGTLITGKREEGVLYFQIIATLNSFTGRYQNDTLYINRIVGDATTTIAGLMSAADKTKLNGIANGATANTGTITGIKLNGVSKGTSGVVDLGNVGMITEIKMNGVSKGTSGVVDLGTVITAHQDISGKVDKTDLNPVPLITWRAVTLNSKISVNTTAYRFIDFTLNTASGNDGGTRGKVLVRRSNTTFYVPAQCGATVRLMSARSI